MFGYAAIRAAGFWRWLAICAGLTFSGAVGLAGFLLTLQALGNFHEVVPGEVYRSAQPTAAQIASYTERYGIRSVLNLRGANPGKPWYDAETAESRRLGLTHVDFRMSAQRELTGEQTEKLFALLADMPKPILIHCQAGADRSGLVSAIYVYKFAGLGEEAAEGQISVRYGHIGVPYLSSTFAMDESWEQLEKVFGLDS